MFGDIYEATFRFILAETAAIDAVFAAHCKAERTAASSDHILSSRMSCSDNALRALSVVGDARTALDKMRCITRFIEMCAESLQELGMGSSADDLIPHVIEHLKDRRNSKLRVHAETSFVRLFSRGEVLICGRDAFCLTTFCAAVSAIDSPSP